MKAGLSAHSSLRVNLMAWLVVPVFIILGISVWLSYGSAVREATLVTDRQLIASARMIAEQIGYDGALTVTIPPSALELFASDSHDEVAYAVEAPGGELIAGYPGLNGPSKPPADFGFQYFETMFRTEAMRATILRQPVITPIGTQSVSVLVGETQKARNELVRNFWIRGFLEQAALVLAASIFIWIGINRQLRPLLRLRQLVLNRPADRFEPFDTGAVQTEIRPLVEALNSHMERLERQLSRQRQFLDSAAHQLRTPLAIMKTQIGVARRIDDAAEIGKALKEVDGNLSAMARLANQLLALGSAEHDRASFRTERVDLSNIAHEIVAEVAPRALDRGIELAFESSGPCAVDASQTLLGEVVRNLIDNTIEYAGHGAIAVVAVDHGDHSATLRVEDNGIGTNDDEKSLLLERFRRGRNSPAGGTGLGLSIVAEIAAMFGGSVALPRTPNDKGFCVVVTLPLAPS